MIDYASLFCGVLGVLLAGFILGLAVFLGRETN